MFTYARDKAKVSHRAVVIYALSTLLVTSATLFYIYPSIRSTSLMYEYAELLSELKKYRILNKKMKLEVSTLKSYDYIEKQAMEELGFVFPAPGQVVIIAKK